MVLYKGLYLVRLELIESSIAGRFTWIKSLGRLVMMEFRKIDWANFWQMIQIKTKKNQERFIQPVSVFLAQSYVNLNLGYPDKSLAIYEEDKLIGYLKMVYVPKNVKPYHMDEDSFMIDALIIDKDYQGKGYGKVALDLAIKEIKAWAQEKAKLISLVCYQDNTVAMKVFSNKGFSLHKNYKSNMVILTKLIERN
jgi:diamine N-acetyltransferase